MRVVIGVFFYFLPINLPTKVVNNRGVMEKKTWELQDYRLHTGLVYRH